MSFENYEPIDFEIPNFFKGIDYSYATVDLNGNLTEDSPTDDLTFMQVEGVVYNWSRLRIPAETKLLVLDVETSHTMPPDFLPIGLEMLRITFMGERSRLSYLPPTLKVLSIGGEIPPITLINIPPSLDVLVFDDTYNHRILDGDFGSATISEFYCDHLDTPLDQGSLPETLKTLHLGSYQHPLEPGILPEGLKKLTLYNYSLPIERQVLPRGLKELYLPRATIGRLSKDFLPSGLNYLFVGTIEASNIESLPDGLETLHIDELHGRLGHDVLPEGLKNLIIEIFDGYLDINVLPEGLEQFIILEDGFNQLLEPYYLPDSLQVLDLGNDYNRFIPMNVLPAGLKTLYLGLNYNQPIEPGVLPAGLSNLVFDSSFNQPIEPGVLPEGLNTLTLGQNFNQPLQPGSLPPSLSRLYMYVNYNQTITSQILPQNTVLILRGTDMEELARQRSQPAIGRNGQRLPLPELRS